MSIIGSVVGAVTSLFGGKSGGGGGGNSEAQAGNDAFRRQFMPNPWETSSFLTDSDRKRNSEFVSDFSNFHNQTFSVGA